MSRPTSLEFASDPFHTYIWDWYVIFSENFLVVDHRNHSIPQSDVWNARYHTRSWGKNSQIQSPPETVTISKSARSSAVEKEFQQLMQTQYDEVMNSIYWITTAVADRNIAVVVFLCSGADAYVISLRQWSISRWRKFPEYKSKRQTYLPIKNHRWRCSTNCLSAVVI